ncbi:hypothetical protein M758_UG310100 [Ceratodon purpureus]|nr:hypothetical protein M758_UG310100 [Ceratodon purpureus]
MEPLLFDTNHRHQDCMFIASLTSLLLCLTSSSDCASPDSISFSTILFSRISDGKIEVENGCTHTFQRTFSFALWLRKTPTTFDIGAITMDAALLISLLCTLGSAPLVVLPTLHKGKLSISFCCSALFSSA